MFTSASGFIYRVCITTRSSAIGASVRICYSSCRRHEDLYNISLVCFIYNVWIICDFIYTLIVYPISRLTNHGATTFGNYVSDFKTVATADNIARVYVLSRVDSSAVVARCAVRRGDGLNVPCYRGVFRVFRCVFLLRDYFGFSVFKCRDSRPRRMILPRSRFNYFDDACRRCTRPRGF